MAVEWLGPAISGAATLAGGAMSYYGAREANRLQMEAARYQNEHQERMSNTSYQRAMEDMKQAGLNPMLAYSQGGAASLPGAKPETRSPLLGTMNSAIDAVRGLADIRRVNAEADMVEAKLPEHKLKGRGYDVANKAADAVERKVLNFVNSAKSSKFKEPIQRPEDYINMKKPYQGFNPFQ